MLFGKTIVRDDALAAFRASRWREAIPEFLFQRGARFAFVYDGEVAFGSDDGSAPAALASFSAAVAAVRAN